MNTTLTSNHVRPPLPTAYPRPRFATLVLAALCIVGTMSGIANAQSPGAEATNLRVPDGQVLYFIAYAKGVQIYDSKAVTGDPSKYEWVLKGPEADLFDSAGAYIGRHFAGPTWETSDGGIVTATRVDSVPSTSPNSIPWLLLKTSATGAPRSLAQTSYVMRVDTHGGLAPDAPLKAGLEVRVPYQATYIFFRLAPSPVAQEHVRDPRSAAFATVDDTAVDGTATSTLGRNIGVAGRSAGANGRGVYGSALSLKGFAFGGEFESQSTDGIGVLGVAYATRGLTCGGNFQTMSETGMGVYGVGRTHSGRNYGVYGQSDSTRGVGVSGITFAAAGPTIGVLGTTKSLKDGFGVFSEGNLGTSGTISVRMVNPIAPNTFVHYYAAQGPQPENIYNGTTTTDNQGEAWVQLPQNFSQLNRDFRYQLTVLDGNDNDTFVQAKIASRVDGSRFKIRTSAPHVAVCWEVKAIRNDSYLRAFPATIDEDSDEN